MLNAGTASLILLIFGPFVFRKFVDWRAFRKHAAQQGHSVGIPSIERLNRFPTPLSLPSNVLLLTSFVVLVIYHGSALLLPSRTALRTDLFLLLGKSVNTPTAVLRTQLAHLDREAVGWRTTWTEEGLTTLLQRLSSFDGRKLHLLIGIDPFVSCTFCDSAKEYIYYSLATRIAQYGADMFLFGILTLRFDALNTIDDVLIMCVQLTSGIDLTPTKKTTEAGARLRAHRYHWRKTVKYVISVFVLCEAAVLTGSYEIGLSQGRWSHWYANRNVAWHGGMLLMAFAVFLGPRTPHIPTLVQIVQSLHRTDALNHELRANLQAAHLTQQIVWQDSEMRQRATKFFQQQTEDEEDDDKDKDDGRAAEESIDGVIDRLARHAQAAHVDVTQLRTQSRVAAQSMWAGSERIWDAGATTHTTSATSSSLLS